MYFNLFSIYKNIIHKYIFFTICLLFVFTNIVFAQKKSSDQKYKRVFQTYGFLRGQQLSLNRIQNELPELSMQASTLALQFDLKFPLITMKLEAYLRTENESVFKIIKKELENKLDSQSNAITIDKKFAEVFFDLLRDRINGKIPSPIIETILSFQYLNNPQDEFIQKHIYTFKTIGNLKSKNSDWQVNIPISWKSMEADRPNIIQKFISDFGEGQESIMLIIKDIPGREHKRISDAEIEDYFKEDNIKLSIPDGSKFVAYKNVTLDGLKGGMLELEQNVQRLEYNFRIGILQYHFIYDGQLYLLQCMVNESDLNKDDVGSRMKKLKPLFHLVANSIVVNSKYNNQESNKESNKKISGTGFAISNEGYIATNYHVVKGFKTIKVKGINGNFNSEFICKLVIKDETNDIAIIKVDSSNFKFNNKVPYAIKLKDSDVGSSVFLLGYPLRQSMGDEIKLTNGIISSRTGYEGNKITYQISAAAQPGNSGCPLFDIDGNIIGIVSAKHPDAENATYAIKSLYLSNAIGQINEIKNPLITNSLKGISLSEQVKLLKNFIYIIETETY
jgi:S1-C subfamily serine protease